MSFPNNPPHQHPHSTVRLLVSRPSTWTTELLGLAPSVIGDEECAVVLCQRLLQRVLRVLVDVFLVVGDDGLGDGLADGVDLRGVTSPGDADADVDASCVCLLAIDSAPIPVLSRSYRCHCRLCV